MPNGHPSSDTECYLSRELHDAPLTSPTERRIRPVRLTDIPLNERMNAAYAAMRDEEDATVRADIFLAALDPSDTTYWVAA